MEFKKGGEVSIGSQGCEEMCVEVTEVIGQEKAVSASFLCLFDIDGGDDLFGAEVDGIGFECEISDWSE